MTDNEDKETFSTQGTGNGEDLWKKAVKDVKKLKKSEAYAETAKPKGKPPPRKRLEPSDSLSKEPPATLPSAPRATASSYQTDGQTEKKLKRGEIEIEARLDLHGQGRVQAYDALVGFLMKAFTNGKKCVLVITGKGGPSKETGQEGRQYGILRENLPEWLKIPPLDAIVLKAQEAHPRHGGKGAFYVLLRKNRTK